MDTGCGEHSNIQVVRRRKFQEDENDRRDWLLWVTDPLGSALQILWRNWSTPIPLGAATARGKFCEKPQKVLGSFEVCAADLMQELEHTYPLVGKRVRQLGEGSSARNRRKSSACWPRKPTSGYRVTWCGVVHPRGLTGRNLYVRLRRSVCDFWLQRLGQRRRRRSSARNRRKSSDPLRSALQILWRNWSTPIPLAREARAARGIALVTIWLARGGLKSLSCRRRHHSQRCSAKK